MANQLITRSTLPAAVATLSKIDRDLCSIVTRHGLPPLWARRPGFATLVQIILGQQVSLASADAAYRRLSQALGRVTPRRVAGRSHAQLTRAGLTRQKARYCGELAAAVLDGRIDLASLNDAAPDQVRAELTRISGIGIWTADVYLLMALRRPDIWPRGDLALYQAMRQVKRVELDPRRLDELADHWRPWRGVAARLLWHHYLASRRS